MPLMIFYYNFILHKRFFIYLQPQNLFNLLLTKNCYYKKVVLRVNGGAYGVVDGVSAGAL